MPINNKGKREMVEVERDRKEGKRREWKGFVW